MKIAVSSYGADLGAEINPRFGRCEYILIVETEDKSVEAISNDNKDLGGGAGIQTASLVIAKGAGAVVTGNCGPNAMDVFTSSGVAVYTGVAGRVDQAIDRFKRGELVASANPTVAEKSGMADRTGSLPGDAGYGAGRGGGGCRAAGGTGMGRGGGRGRGRGMGMGRRR